MGLKFFVLLLVGSGFNAHWICAMPQKLLLASLGQTVGMTFFAEFVAAMTQFSSQFNEWNHESQQHESIFLLIFICTMHNTSRQMLFLLESYYSKHTSPLRFFFFDF